MINTHIGSEFNPFVVMKQLPFGSVEAILQAAFELCYSPFEPNLPKSTVFDLMHPLPDDIRDDLMLKRDDTDLARRFNADLLVRSLPFGSLLSILFNVFRKCYDPRLKNLDKTIVYRLMSSLPADVRVELFLCRSGYACNDGILSFPTC